PASRAGERRAPARDAGRPGSAVAAASYAPHLGRKRIAAAPNRLDQLRLARIAFELLAQTADVIVDAPLERAEITMLRQIEQLVAREHAPWMGNQRKQQIVLAGRERDLPPGLVDQLAFAGAKYPIAKGVGLRVGRL